MATTSMWHISTRLDKVLSYVKNPEKTRQDIPVNHLRKVLHYAADPAKTEHAYFNTGINCTVAYAYEEMQEVKAQFGKAGGRVAYHGYQSFSPGEVTPEEAHRIGIELAKELFGDRHQILVSTHTDQQHIHNHFVLNSVSYVDGKKYVRTDADYRAMRKVSDRLCLEHGKSIIQDPKPNVKRQAEIIALRQGKPTIRTQLMRELDDIIAKSFNFNHFLELLKKEGYKVRGGNLLHLSITPPFGARPIRLDGLSGYSPQQIQERIMAQRHGVPPSIQAEHEVFLTMQAPRPKNYRYATPPPTRRGIYIPYWGRSFRAKYYFFLYYLRRAQARKAPPPVRHALRRDVLQYERYKEQAAYLNRHHLDTSQQLDQHEHHIDSLISTLTDNRRDLYREKRRGNLNVGGEIEKMTNALRELRKEQRILNRIRSREPDISKQLYNTRRQIKAHRRKQQYNRNYHKERT